MSDMTPPCTLCQSVLHNGLTEVHMRVPYRAAEFQSKRDLICAECRKKNNGMYRLARKRPV